MRSTKAPTISYSDARKLYRQFDQTLSQVGLWEKKRQPERVQLLQDSIKHRDAVSKAFGDFSACASAAAMHVEFVSNLNAIVFRAEGGSQVQTFYLLSALRAAESFGNHRAPCYDAVEALDTPVKK